MPKQMNRNEHYKKPHYTVSDALKIPYNEEKYR